MQGGSVTRQLPNTGQQQHVFAHIPKKERGDKMGAHSTNEMGESDTHYMEPFWEPSTRIRHSKWEVRQWKRAVEIP